MVGGTRYKFYFDPEKRILFKKHLGNVTMEQIFSSWDEAIRDNLIPSDTKGFVVDVRKAHYGIELAKVKTITRYFDSHPDIFSGKKMAVVVTSPEEIVLPVLIEYTPKSYSLKPFATETAALMWILQTP